MDGPGTPESPKVRFQRQSPNKTFGLLRAGNGGIRGYQRARPILPRCGLGCCRARGRGYTTWETSRGGRVIVHGRCVGGIGTLLDSATGQPAEHRGRAPVFGESFKILDATSTLDDNRRIDDGFTKTELFRVQY